MSYNFNIETNYLTAVQNFNWPNDAAAADLPISLSELDQLVNEVAEKIIAASQLKTTFEALARRSLSLREVCYAYVQDYDKKFVRNTVAKIENASDQEKKIFNHAFKKLSELFVQVESNNLKEISLLFSIHKISELASKNTIVSHPKTNIPPQQLDRIAEIEKILAGLIATKNQYSDENLVQAPQEVREFFASVDATIIEKTHFLNTLKSQKNENS